MAEACPDGARFAQIVSEAKSEGKRWRLFIPRDYISLLSVLEESQHLRVVAYDPSVAAIRRALLEANFVDLGFPVEWDPADNHEE